jgi:hypothetical protein
MRSPVTIEQLAPAPAESAPGAVASDSAGLAFGLRGGGFVMYGLVVQSPPALPPAVEDLGDGKRLLIQCGHNLRVVRVA